MAVQVISSCRIQSGKVTVNEASVFSASDEEFPAFLKAAYRALALAYPKFFKMDKLCQLAFIGSEFLLKSITKTFRDDEVALCFFNKSSSLDTDRRHQELINEGKKISPALFVYTLPNIMMGEIAIKNKWYGENLLILRPDFNFEEWSIEADLLISSGKANYCLGGWVEVLRDKYELNLFLVEAAGIKMSLTSK